MFWVRVSSPHQLSSIKQSRAPSLFAFSLWLAETCRGGEHRKLAPLFNKPLALTPTLTSLTLTVGILTVKAFNLTFKIKILTFPP